MPKLTLQALGRLLNNARGIKGVREAAKEAGVSPATFSRVERGYRPDLETLVKLCAWLRVDPSEVLGTKLLMHRSPIATVHFRKGKVMRPKTARALAEMILSVQRALLASGEESE